ncbi:MAG: UDP-N-acetylmuramate dehydrogenase [Sphaerochaetaceae bacterium]|nr:UDP-N-acetylmuramate dehydrogenase [Sphaerochaetaceae bacterium]
MSTTIRNAHEKINTTRFLTHDVSLKPFCSFHTGGSADIFGTPSNLHELRMLIAYARENDLPITVLGGGTNVLISDKGIKGLTIHTAHLKNFHIRGTLLCAQAGCSIDRIIQGSIEHALSGMELLGGLPGTIGGAVRGNAGVHQVHIGDWVEWVDYLDHSGNLMRTHKEELDFSYKHSFFSETTGIIYEVAFRLIPNKATSEAMRLKEQSRKERLDAGQYAFASAGCIFKNPEGLSAGAMIEKIGLKQKNVNGAMVSPFHANFIVNQTGSASSNDVRSLAQEVATQVKKQLDIDLEYEVQFMGDWSD